MNTILQRPVGVCLRGRLSSNVRPHTNTRSPRSRTPELQQEEELVLRSRSGQNMTYGNGSNPNVARPDARVRKTKFPTQRFAGSTARNGGDRRKPSIEPRPDAANAQRPSAGLNVLPGALTRASQQPSRSVVIHRQRRRRRERSRVPWPSGPAVSAPKVRPNTSLKRRPATAATAWPLQVQWVSSFRGQSASASTVALARTLGLARPIALAFTEIFRIQRLRIY